MAENENEPNTTSNNENKVKLILKITKFKSLLNN